MKPAVVLLLCAAAPALAAEPLSYGRPGCGKLTGGVALRCSGDNFEAASSALCLARRNHVHPLVARTVEDAYALLRTTHPRRRWQYGETGFPDGGRFRPHKTHQSGTSADFFVPVVDAAGAPDVVPIHPLNLLGYRVDFDAHGRSGGQRIDFAALGAHLLALKEAGRAHGVGIAKVILWLPLQKHLFGAVPELQPLRRHFNTRNAWVLHDEHYHVDFTLPKAAVRPWRCKK